MALSDLALRNARAQSKQFKLYDERGLFVIVTTAGGKLWRMKFQFDGKEQLLSLGTYPDVGLKDARLRRDEARQQLADGLDPRVARERKALAAKLAASNTFRLVADEFIAKREMDGLSEATLIKLRWFASLIDGDVGKRAVSEIEPFELLTAIKKIEKLGNHETAKRVRAFAARVFRYAIITGRARINPAADLGMALVVPRVKHHAAVLDPEEVGALLRALDTYTGYPPGIRRAFSRASHKFTPTRPN